MKPTRIVSKPYFKQVGPKGFKMLPCDNGNEYCVKDLAEVLGVTPQRLASRIRNAGWDHPKVLCFSDINGGVPTRVIAEPYKIGRRTYLPCDDGKDRTISDLIRIFGRTQTYWSKRLRVKDWRDPEIFRTEYKQYEQFQDSPYKMILDGDLAHLSATNNRYGELVI